ncbi:MAG: hypothetical protein ACU0DW_13690 [Shimia sp.]
MSRTTRARLNRLEAARAPHRVEDGATELIEHLARIEQAVIDSGDFSDKPSASKAERTVRRILRGEVDAVTALQEALNGTWPRVDMSGLSTAALEEIAALQEDASD